MKYEKYSCPIKTVQISSKNPDEQILNPCNIKVGKDKFGNCNRVYILLNLDKLPRNLNVKRAVLYIPIIDSNEGYDGILQGFKIDNNIRDLNEINWNTKLDINFKKCLFRKKYYKNSMTIIDITEWVNENIYETSNESGILLTTNEFKEELAIINGKMFKNDGIKLVVLSEECDDSKECFNYKKANFFQKVIKVNTCERIYCSKPICVGDLKLYTVFFKNNGPGTVEFELENSTNCVDYMPTEEIISIEPGGYKAATAYFFSKYIRVVIHSNVSSIIGNITIQGQFYK